MINRRLPLRAALLTMTALIGVSACGTDSGSETPTPAPTVATAAPTGSATPTPSSSAASVKESSDTGAIKVTGAYGKQPKVEVKAPFAIDKTRNRVLEPNKSGAAIGKGQTVEFNYYAVNARTGKEFDNSFKTGRPIAFPLGQLVPGFEQGLVGERQGSRVLLVIPGVDGYDKTGGQADAGIEVGDTLIFVVDVLSVQLSGPQGKAVAPKKGLPTVSGPENKPSLSVPKLAPPKELQVQPLIKGTGKEVAATDTVTFNYRWVKWSDGKLLEETYGTKPASAALSGLLPGMQKGLIGQKVGSRVLLVIPPAEGYPDGNESPKIEKDETLVMVVDLLFTAAG